ncbi:MAG: hypothetical protein M1828_001679 [Chrysothrix sp. TS-e1954]|nr:MAG: hypothetical protein M1828_001679 [Chrysothrix sp. TS-e1954]
MDLSALLMVILTIFIPPLGPLLLAGCGADLLINICLTVLGYFPGHIHAFYLEYVYYSRRDAVLNGGRLGEDAGGIYSENVQCGGFARGEAGMGGQRDGLVAQGGQTYGTTN